MNAGPKILCIVSHEQQREYSGEFGLLKRHHCSLQFDSSPQSAIDSIEETNPDAVILGSQVGEFEGLELLSMITSEHRDFVKPVILLNDKEDGMPAVIHLISSETGRSSVEAVEFERLAQIISQTF